MVPVFINANNKTHTVEELHTQKKDMHVSAFRHLLVETARDLENIAEVAGAQGRLSRDPFRVGNLQDWIERGGKLEWLLDGMSDGTEVTFTVAGLLSRIMRQVEVVLEQHEAMPLEQYNDNKTFRYIVAEMLETSAAAVSTLRGYIEDRNLPIEAVMRNTITGQHRAYLSFLERMLPAAGEARASAAVELCRVMGVMQSSADEVNTEGLTPLMHAAADGAGARVVRCLVAAGADVNRREARTSRTALWFAVEGGHVAALEELERLGSDVDAVAYTGCFDCTPLYVAAEEGHTAVIAALARLGADVNRGDKDGRTPVYAAAQMGHAAAIKALGDLRADVNLARHDGRTPMYIAAQMGQTAAIEALGKLGADPNLACNCGWTPLYIATTNGHAEAADALRSLGAAS
jgi:hypothetical protein